MTALLPEGRFVQDPDSTKLVKVVPGANGHVVIIKLDDDTEIMVKTCPDAESAFAFADKCTNALNGDDDDPSEEEPPSSDVRPAERHTSEGATPTRASGSSTSKTTSNNTSTQAGIETKSQTKSNQENDSDWSDSEVNETSSLDAAQSKSEANSEQIIDDEPVEFPSFGSALENSLEDSDEWPFDDGQDDWHD